MLSVTVAIGFYFEIQAYTVINGWFCMLILLSCRGWEKRGIVYHSHVLCDMAYI